MNISDRFKINPNDVTFHNLVALNPRLTQEEYEELKIDFDTKGQMDPIRLTNDMLCYDGRHRVQIALELGFKNLDAVKLLEPVDDEKIYSLVLSTEKGRSEDAFQKTYKAIKYRESMDENISQDELAKMFGISRMNVSALTLIYSYLENKNKKGKIAWTNIERSLDLMFNDAKIKFGITSYPDKFQSLIDSGKMSPLIGSTRNLRVIKTHMLALITADITEINKNYTETNIHDLLNSALAVNEFIDITRSCKLTQHAKIKIVDLLNMKYILREKNNEKQ